MAEDEKPSAAEPTPKPARRRAATPAVVEPEAKPAAPAKKSETKAARRRPTLAPETARLLSVRSDLGGRRPKFVRTASHRYFRIGRWNSWRRPKGLQSKQRRHYGYRPFVVRIGYGGPRATRNLTSTGFLPVVVRTDADLQAIDIARQAAIIARTVGTRRRLTLEETCRKLGIHVLNPIVKDREAT